jgi:DMSO/TMAO reductase YedYZ molybdopterin-dependent catalytic subunit
MMMDGRQLCFKMAFAFRRSFPEVARMRSDPASIAAVRKTLTISPENSETPLDEAAEWVTPTRLFFVRNHFEVPPVPSGWAVELEGLVSRPISWTMAELAAQPQHTVAATVECAGNGRSFLREKAAGVQWGAGAVAHAEWTGVSVARLLTMAGVGPGARDVVFEGADRGLEAGHPEPIGFSRSLPLSKAMHPDTLIALRMNGQPLEPNHGAPARLFVPGWYGVASVKWLRRIRVIDHAYQGYFQTEKYVVERRTERGIARLALGPGIVKSEILSPATDAQLTPGTYRITGLAWAGEDRVARVDVSTTGGSSWQTAQILGESHPYAWCRWESLWTVRDAGRYTIMARAWSELGQCQPFEYDPHNLGYLVNMVLPRTVYVRSGVGEAPANSGWVETMEEYTKANASRQLDFMLPFTGGDGI